MSDAPEEIKVRGYGVKLMLAIIAGVVAYFLTIQEIKSDISGKASAASVNVIDVKLNQLETMAQEQRLTRAEFYAFRDECIRRLARIETLLEREKEVHSR